MPCISRQVQAVAGIIGTVSVTINRLAMMTVSRTGLSCSKPLWAAAGIIGTEIPTQIGSASVAFNGSARVPVSRVGLPLIN